MLFSMIVDTSIPQTIVSAISFVLAFYIAFRIQYNGKTLKPSDLPDSVNVIAENGQASAQADSPVNASSSNDNQRNGRWGPFVRWVSRRKSKRRRKSNRPLPQQPIHEQAASQVVPKTTYSVPKNFRVMRMIRVKGFVRIESESQIFIKIETSAGFKIEGHREFRFISETGELELFDNIFGEFKRTTVTDVRIEDDLLTVRAFWEGKVREVVEILEYSCSAC